MGGLTSSHIFAKLVAAGTNAAPQSIILEFPNIVAGATALAGVESSEGPLKETGGTLAASLVFSLGNVTITISSVGDKTADVSAIALHLDHTRGETSFKEELKAGKAERLTKDALKVKMGQKSTFIECLPERETTGWHKLIAPDGEIKREDDAIVYASPSAGEKKIERYHVAPQLRRTVDSKEEDGYV